MSLKSSYIVILITIILLVLPANILYAGDTKVIGLKTDVITFNYSGNGTWQALPPIPNVDSVEMLEKQINYLIDIIESQNEKISRLENRLAEIENN